VVPAEDMEALLWLVAVVVLGCSVLDNGPPVYVDPLDVFGGR